MARLSRLETQERTHARLLAAGREVFLRRGYLAATVDEIAEAAGHTRGAVYKHFGGKEGLWQAIVDAIADSHLAALAATLESARTRADLLTALNPSRFARGGDAYGDAHGRDASGGAHGPAAPESGAPPPDSPASAPPPADSSAPAAGGGAAAGDVAARWALASAEYLAAVAAQPEHSARLVALQHRLDAALAELLARHCPRLGVRPALPIPALVTALGAFGGGLALLSAADPSLDAGAVSAALLDVLLREA